MRRLLTFGVLMQQLLRQGSIDHLLPARMAVLAGGRASLLKSNGIAPQATWERR